MLLIFKVFARKYLGRTKTTNITEHGFIIIPYLLFTRALTLFANKPFTFTGDLVILFIIDFIHFSALK